MCVFTFSATFVYSYQIFMQRESSPQISDKDSNIRFHKNPFSGSRVVQCGMTGRQAWWRQTSLLAILRTRLKMNEPLLTLSLSNGFMISKSASRSKELLWEKYAHYNTNIEKSCILLNGYYPIDDSKHEGRKRNAKTLLQNRTLCDQLLDWPRDVTTTTSRNSAARCSWSHFLLRITLKEVWLLNNISLSTSVCCSICHASVHKKRQTGQNSVPAKHFAPNWRKGIGILSKCWE